jgi:GeoRSP system SPASM domain protein
MSLDLLDTPVRLTWDFPEKSFSGECGYIAIARSIRDAGVFYVTLQGHPLLHANLVDVLRDLSDLQCMLVCHVDDQELKALEQLSASNIQLLLDVTTFVSDTKKFASLLLAETVQRIRDAGFDPVLTMTPLKGNLELIPDILAFCNEHEITKLKLPNAHIGGSFHEYSADELPRWEDLRKFSNLWEKSVSSLEVLPAMEVHDLFLWEIMTPDRQQNRSEYGGCQAANSLAHIDINGVVHPCSAWPQPLGQLPDQSLEDIWAGRERQSVVEKIAITPVGCQGCSDLNLCLGGCRGLAQSLNQSAGERDLMCCGPR